MGATLVEFPASLLRRPLRTEISIRWPRAVCRRPPSHSLPLPPLLPQTFHVVLSSDARRVAELTNSGMSVRAVASRSLKTADDETSSDDDSTSDSSSDAALATAAHRVHQSSAERITGRTTDANEIDIDDLGSESDCASGSDSSAESTEHPTVEDGVLVAEAAGCESVEDGSAKVLTDAEIAAALTAAMKADGLLVTN